MDIATFLTILVSGICTGGVMALFASSFGFQVGALRMPNFGFGNWIMIAMYLSFVLISMMQIGILFAIIPIAAVYFAIGYALKSTLLKKGSSNTLIIATMGIGLVLQNVALMIFTANPRSLGITETTVEVFRHFYISLSRLLVAAIAAVLLIAFHFLLTKTWAGKAIRAIVLERDAAVLMGINASRYISLAFAFSYLMIAFSGLMLLVLFPVTPDAGGFYQITSFTICVMAGGGNFRGSIYAGISLGVVTAFLNFFISAYSNVIIFALFIAILVFRPNGIFARTKKEQAA